MPEVVLDRIELNGADAEPALIRQLIAVVSLLPDHFLAANYRTWERIRYLRQDDAKPVLIDEHLPEAVLEVRVSSA